MAEKEYTFQCIISYEAEDEEEAKKMLQEDLRQNGNSLFDYIQVTNKEDE